MAKRGTIVLFDIGGVLLRLSYSRFFSRCADVAGCSEGEFKEMYIQSGIEKRANIGKDDAEGLLREFGGIIGNPDMPEPELMELIALTWGGPIKESIRLKRRIYDKGYAVGIFSNISDIALRILSKRHAEIFDVFEPSFPKVMSFQVGETKPGRKMYETIKGFDNVVYIDDSINYVTTGIREFGWKGIHYTPYIDRDEVQRIFDKEVKPAKGMITANSHKGLIEALEKSGIGLD